MTTQPITSRKQSLLSAILITGIIAGIADGLAAIINFYISTGRGPAPIFKSIAGGLFGMEAFTGGTSMIIWGVFLHLSIAMLFTAFFFLIFPGLRLAGKNKFLVAIVYGLFVWLVMNQLVLPASRLPHITFKWDKAITGALILIVCIGLPVSLLANRYYRLHRI